ncbi:MAG TPA: Stp1/IreP family PP2C-type Ser/Thr phosphatase [Patescibacteria group bacterium]|nr:Stp1/IreP family PP2C-type Ser/Thr phosphatase [Patescibacteria group bacterium]
MLAHAASDIGKIRTTNEDSFLCVPPHLYIVADGMGGHAAGEIASQLGVNTVAGYVAEQPFPDHPTQQGEILLRQAVEQANAVIFSRARTNPEYAGMGSTLTVVYVTGEDVFWSHLGDSRLYLFRGQQLAQITNDHSLVGELLRSGALTRAEAQVHPQRNILTRAAGVSEQAEVDSGHFSRKPGDRLLLCTDGLTGLLTDDEITAILSVCTGQQALHTLITEALNAGGIDNITAILLENSL